MPRLYRVCKDIYTLLPSRNTFSNANVNILKSNENILIDCGSVNEPSFPYLNRLLNNLDIKTIDKIIITHSHVDHYQNIGEFADEFGAEVFAHKNAIPILKHERSLEGFEFWELVEETYPRIHQSYLIRRLVTMGYNYFVYRRGKRIDHITPVEEGDVIGDFKVFFIPGHSSDSIGLLDKERKVLFTGDMIPWTPYIHTSIEDFRASIKKILDYSEQYDIKMMIRGHQKPILAAIERANYRSFLEDMERAEKRILKLLQQKKELTVRQMLPYIFQRTHFVHNLLYRIFMRTQQFWTVKYLKELEEKNLIKAYKRNNKKWYSLSGTRSGI